MNLKIVPGMFVCSSFLISVCMFIVSKALLISSATVIVRLFVVMRHCMLAHCNAVSFVISFLFVLCKC